MPNCDKCGAEFSHNAWYGTGRVCLPCQGPAPLTPYGKEQQDAMCERATRECDAWLALMFPRRSHG